MTNRPYGDTPFHDSEVIPCITTTVYLLGIWAVLFKTTYVIKLTKYISDLTEVEPYTSWTDMIYIKNKCSANISRIFEENWLDWYPRPDRVVYDNVTEFKGWEYQTLLYTCGI